MPFTKEAISEYKASVDRVKKFFSHLFYGEYF